MDINEVDQFGMSSLHYACMRGDKKMAEMLLDAGADVNVNKMQPPIFTCALFGYSDVFKILIERGADTSVKNINGNDVKSVLRDMKRVVTTSNLSREINKMLGTLERLK